MKKTCFILALIIPILFVVSNRNISVSAKCLDEEECAGNGSGGGGGDEYDDDCKWGRCEDNDYNDNGHGDCRCGGLSQAGGCDQCNPCARNSPPDWCEGGGTNGGSGGGGNCTCVSRQVPQYTQRCEWVETRNDDMVRRCTMVLTGWTTVPGDPSCPGCGNCTVAYYSPDESTICSGVPFQRQGYSADGQLCGSAVQSVGTKNCNCSRCAGLFGCIRERWADSFASPDINEECVDAVAVPIDNGATADFSYSRDCSCGIQYLAVGETGVVNNSECVNCPIDAELAIVNINTGRTIPPEGTGIPSVVGNHSCQNGFLTSVAGGEDEILQIKITVNSNYTSVKKVSIGLGNDHIAYADNIDQLPEGIPQVSAANSGVSGLWYFEDRPWIPLYPPYSPDANHFSVYFWMRFNSNFPDNLQQLRFKVDAVSGATRGWVIPRDSAGNFRHFRVWNCQVPMSGTIYDSSSSNGAVCASNIGFNNPAGDSLNFKSLNLVSQQVGDTITTTVSGSSSYSTNGGMTWGRTYGAHFNTDLNGAINSPVKRMSTTNPLAPLMCQPFVQLSGTFPVNPYYQNPQFKSDYAFLRNQEPWFQVMGGGVASNGSITDNVPPTCTATSGCTPAVSIGTTSNSGDNVGNGLVIAGVSVVNNSGCGSQCKAGSPGPDSISGLRVVKDEGYEKMLSSVYKKLGVGITMIGDVKMSEIKARTSNTDDKVVFVNGNVEIDENNEILSGMVLGESSQIAAVLEPIDPLGPGSEEEEPLPPSLDGKTMMIVTSGNITINPNVDRVDAILIADGLLQTPGPGDNQLVINGAVWTRAGTSLTRGFATPGANNTKPGVLIKYQPTLVFNLPGRIFSELTNLGEVR